MPDDLAEAKAELARRDKSNLAEAKAELARRGAGSAKDGQRAKSSDGQSRSHPTVHQAAPSVSSRSEARVTSKTAQTTPKLQPDSTPASKSTESKSASPFALKDSAGKTVLRSTIGPPHAEAPPNLLQRIAQGAGQVLGYPQALVSSLAFPVHQALHTSRGQMKPDEGGARRDAASVAALSKMNPFQRAAALEGQIPLDPLMGRPHAQNLRDAADRARFGPADAVARMATQMATDPVAHGLGPAGKLLPKAGRVGIATAFGAQMATEGVAKIQHAAATHDKSEATEGALDIAMAAFSGAHGKHEAGVEGHKAEVLASHLLDRSVAPKQGLINRLSSRYGVKTAELTRAVDRQIHERTAARQKEGTLAAKDTPMRHGKPAPAEEVKAAVAKKPVVRITGEQQREAVKQPTPRRAKPAAVEPPKADKPKTPVEAQKKAPRSHGQPAETKGQGDTPPKPKAKPETKETSDNVTQEAKRAAVPKTRAAERAKTSDTKRPEPEAVKAKPVSTTNRAKPEVKKAEALPARGTAASLKKQPAPSVKPVKMRYDRANTLATSMGEGALANKLEAARKGMVSLTPEEAQELRDHIRTSSLRLDPKRFPELYSKDVPSPVTKPAPAVRATLPDQLSKAAPRYGYGNRNFTLTFRSDIDRAAYITAQGKRSSQDAAYLKFVMDNTGMTEEQVRAHGAEVKAHIKGIASSTPQGTINISVKDHGTLSAKDKAIIAKGPQELGAGVNPFALLRKAKESQGGQAATDFLYGDKAALTHESKAGLEAVNRHENAHSTAGIDADRVLPPVTAHLSADDRARFGAYGIADRLAEVKGQAQDIIAKAPARRKVLIADVKKAEANQAAAIATGDAATIRKAMDALKEARGLSQGHLKAVADAKKAVAENALERVGNPHSFVLPSTGKTVPIREADIKPFFDRPEIKAALAAHKAGGEALLNEYQKAQGNQAGVSIGKYSKAYFPAHALDDTGALRRASSGKGGRHQASATMAQNVSAKQFEGNAHAYDTSYDDFMREAMQRSYSRATERHMHQTLLSEGVMQPYDLKSANQRIEDGRLEVKYKGKWEPATDFSIQKYGARDDRLPDRVVMPSRLYREIKPLFDPHIQTLTDQVANTMLHTAMRTYLMAPADAVQHGAALGSRAAYGVAKGAGGADSGFVSQSKQAGRGFLAPAQSAVNFIRFWNPNLYKTTLRAEAMRHMSEAGVLPHDFGDVGNKPGADPKNVLDRRNYTVGRTKRIGHNILYGDRGLLSNAGTAVYKSFKDSGALSKPEGVQMMHQAMRETFNTYSKTDKAALGTWAQTVGAGSFYSTGVKNRTAALSAGKHVYAASLAARAIVTIGAVRSVTGKYPWEIPGYKWGYLPIFKDKKTGEVIMADARIFDRVGFYPDQIVHALAQGAYDTKTHKVSARGAGLEAGADIANWATAPVASGPVPQVAGATLGKMPYFVPNRTLSGLDIIDHPAVKLGMTGKRALAVAGSAVPFLSLMVDPAHEMTASAPKSSDAQKINWWIKKVGLPQLRAATDPAVVIKRRKAQERAAVRADAKAEGRTPPAIQRGSGSLSSKSGGLFGGRGGL